MVDLLEVLIMGAFSVLAMGCVLFFLSFHWILLLI